MIFLIEYDRRKGSIVSMEEFEGSDRAKAETSRLEMELKLNRSHTEHEVVLLEAATKTALQRTHRRYFENLSQLATSHSVI